jgi:hypothetical protein
MVWEMAPEFGRTPGIIGLSNQVGQTFMDVTIALLSGKLRKVLILQIEVTVDHP